MTVTTYVWNELTDNVVMESDDEGNVTTYTHTPELHGKVLSQNRNGVDSYFHYDGQGSVRQVTDSTGAVTDEMTYTAFGEVVAKTGSTVNPWGYKGALGYYTNAGSKDLYVRARHLSPPIGRWMSADPVGHEGGVTNLYLYVRNPIDSSDPSGRDPCDKVTPVQYQPPNWRDLWDAPRTTLMIGSGEFEKCDSKKIVVEVHAHHFPGGLGGPSQLQALQDANMVFAQCCIEFRLTRKFNADKKLMIDAIGADGCVKVTPGLWQAIQWPWPNDDMRNLGRLVPAKDRDTVISIFFAKCIEPSLGYGVTPPYNVDNFHPV